MDTVNFQIFLNKSKKTIDGILIALDLKKPVKIHFYFPEETNILKEFLILPLEDDRFEFSYTKSNVTRGFQGTLTYTEK